jgi:predicted enzyme related to lactoylglutathione lyase
VKAIHFDLSVRDLSQARTFFERVLGWRFERFPMPYECYRIQAGAADEPGIDGSIGAAADAPVTGGVPMTQITVPSDDLDALLARVVDAGGRVVEQRLAIPGVGWYATCAEPGGLRFGVLQADPNAT